MSSIWSAYVDGSPAIPLRPITLTATMRNAAPSYYAISLGFDPLLLETLLERIADVVRIERDGAAWGFFNQEAPLVSQGGRSGTITLRGYRQQTYTAPNSISIESQRVIERRFQADGSVSISVDPSLDPRPLDLVSWAGSNWTIKRLDLLAGERRRLNINMTEVLA